jgi:polyhydroxybutyrate depolymerase
VGARAAGAVAAAGLVLALAVGCGGGGERPDAGATERADRGGAPATGPAGRAGSCPAALDGGILRLPARPRPGATPLVVLVVPGGSGDPLDLLGVGRAATRAGVAVLSPVARTGGFWTLNDRQGRRDVEDVRDLLDRALAPGCFDPDRISITGVSNGAGFAVRMACELPGRFAAVVPVAAGLRALDPCPPAVRTSFLAIHGTADTVVPYDGRPPARRGSVPRYAARWAQRAGCGPRAASAPRPLVTRYRWRPCPDGLRVEVLRLRRTEHGWPSASGSGNPSRLSATRELLRFVRGARRP